MIPTLLLLRTDKDHGTIFMVETIAGPLNSPKKKKFLVHLFCPLYFDKHKINVTFYDAVASGPNSFLSLSLLVNYRLRWAYLFHVLRKKSLG